MTQLTTAAARALNKRRDAIDDEIYQLERQRAGHHAEIARIEKAIAVLVDEDKELSAPLVDLAPCPAAYPAAPDEPPPDALELRPPILDAH